MTEFDPGLVLSQPLMANLATLSPEGPRNAPVWFLWEEETLWIPSSTSSSSVTRLAQDDRVAVEIVRFDLAAGGLFHLGLRGRAEVVAMDVPLFRRLLAKYLGPDENKWNPWFIENVACFDDPEGRFIRLRPETIFTKNVSFFRTGPDLAWCG
jgi:hypothetical protein